MLWFTVWTVLVVGSVVCGFFVLRRLYRQGRALAEEGGRAADVLAGAAERATRLAAQVQEELTLSLVVLDDASPARARRVDLAVVKARRRAERHLRHEATYRRWRAFSH